MATAISKLNFHDSEESNGKFTEIGRGSEAYLAAVRYQIG